MTHHEEAEAVVYLDFDGCLHAEDVVRGSDGEPKIRFPGGASLFEHAALLEQLLAPYPRVRIVLSTTWAHTFGQEGATVHLARHSRDLAGRVIGSTWKQWLRPSAPRGLRVARDVRARGLAEGRWLAIDDTDDGWLQGMREHLVLSHPVLGIGDKAVLADLTAKLRRFEESKE